MDTALKTMLDERGLSVSAYARISGVPQSTLHRIVSGEVDLSAVTVGTFLKIAHGLGLSAEELYYDDPYYSSDKSEVDIAFATTSPEGRMALLACARGVQEVFPPSESGLLPEMGADAPDFSTP